MEHKKEEHTKEKVARYTLLTASVIYSLIFTAISFVIIAVVAYFFGYNLLRNPMSGNDAMNTLTYARWINEYYPNLPLWYPSSAGGSSFLLGYPSFYSYSVVVLSRFAHLDLFQSMGIINFASLLLPAWGVFLVVLIRFRMRVAALFAGLFYLLSPISYVLISGAGFLANAYAAIYAVPFLFFLEWHLTLWIENGSIRKKIVTLFFGGIFFVLTTLAHPVATLGIMMLMGFYVLLFGALKDKVAGAGRGLIGLIIASIIFYLLCAFWFKPFQDYTAFSNRDITFIANTATLPPVSFTGMLGLEDPAKGYQFPNLSIVPFVWVIAGIGSIIALLLKRYKTFVFGILSLICLYLMGRYDVWIFFTKINWLVGSFFVNRYYYTATMILLPIVAGIGLWLFCSLPFIWFMEKLKKTHLAIAISSKIIFSIIITVIACVVTLWGLFAFNKFDGYYKSSHPERLHYGEETGINKNALWNRATLAAGIPNYCDKSSRGYAGLLCENPAVNNNLEVSTFIYYCDIYQKADPQNRPYYCLGSKNEGETNRPLNDSDIQEFISRCKNKQYDSDYFADLCLSIGKTPQEQLQNWPKVRLADVHLSSLETYPFTQPNNPFYFLTLPNTRLDVSPSIGSWTKEWGTTTKSSIINAYTGQLVLNKSFNSVFMDTMYQNNDQPAVSVDEIAKYFGIQAIIDSNSDESKRFEAQKWKKTEVGTNRYVWQPPFKNSIYSIQQKPLVLIIGTEKDQAYKQIFQLGTLGAIPYDKAIMIEGKEKIDDYSLQDLQKYDMVVLSGYSYSNQANTFNMLDYYIKQGGTVFIDNGWQYVSPDWGKGADGKMVFPQWMPVKSTTWGNIGDSWDNAEVDSPYEENVSVSSFNPLKWGSDPWSVAYADRSDLQSWAQPILSKGDKVIMAAGSYGSGRIVWSGLNFPSHALNPINTNEITLFNNVMSYLLPTKDAKQITDFSYTRTPDMLTVPINDSSWSNSAFYFAESYYPYWKASLIKSNGVSISLPIQNAGPRFMLVKLPEVSTGDKLIFEFNGGWKIILPVILSIIAWLGLIVFIFDAFFFDNKIGQAFIRLFSHGFKFASQPMKKKMKKMNLDLGKEEEDY